MSERQETVDDIIAEARDKHTVHECNQCAWRKCCSRGFGSEECGKFRESIWLHLGIEDGYFTQLLNRLDAAHKREMSKNASKNGADFGQLGDVAKLRGALKLYDRIFQDRTLIYDCDIVYGARTLARAALAAPPRNCDRFGGGIDKLREACARERGLNPEEDFPDVFPDWLLALAQKGGAK